MTARAAAAIWPYPHRTIAEIDAEAKARSTSRGKGPRALERLVGHAGYNGPVPERQRAASSTCFRCGARSCDHREGIAA